LADRSKINSCFSLPPLPQANRPNRNA
jgi:hypothetical protein